MPAERPTDTVDLDRLERLLIILSLLSFGLVALGLIGEYRGWWNDVGEMIISFGTVAGVATGVVALVVNSTKTQVRRVADGVEGNGHKLDRIHESHGDKLDQIHDSLGDKLDQVHDDHGERLEDLAERIGPVDEPLAEKLDRQHDVLVQIRDRL